MDIERTKVTATAILLAEGGLLPEKYSRNYWDVTKYPDHAPGRIVCELSQNESWMFPAARLQSIEKAQIKMGHFYFKSLKLDFRLFRVTLDESVVASSNLLNQLPCGHQREDMQTFGSAGLKVIALQNVNSLQPLTQTLGKGRITIYANLKTDPAATRPNKPTAK